jgi:6-phosphofructokinase 1
MKLTPEAVRDVHEYGGTILSTTRGGFDKKKIIDAVVEAGINQIYIIGGDGTHRGAYELYKEARSRNLKIVVAGIPKTIDNDIALIDNSFGFQTAVEEATKAVVSAKVEAQCTPNGIGIVKVMGRNAGFIAAHTTLAARNVDACLIPEVPIVLEGPNGLFAHVEASLKKNKKCVIVVAEGAGDELMASKTTETDASGNKKLPPIGLFLEKEIKGYFAGKVPISIKYNDPAYMIRSVPANAHDSISCMILAQNAVHGCMAGYTGFTSACVNNRSVMIPIPLITATSPSYLNPSGRTWERVTRITGQPYRWGHFD